MPFVCFCFWPKAACGAGPRQEGGSGSRVPTPRPAQEESPRPGGRAGAPASPGPGAARQWEAQRSPAAARGGCRGSGAQDASLRGCPPPGCSPASAGAAAEKPRSVLHLMPDQTVLPNEGALQSACNAEFLMLPRALLHNKGGNGSRAWLVGRPAPPGPAQVAAPAHRPPLAPPDPPLTTSAAGQVAHNTHRSSCPAGRVAQTFLKCVDG